MASNFYGCWLGFISLVTVSPQSQVSPLASSAQRLSTGLWIPLLIHSRWLLLFETSFIHWALYLPYGWPTPYREPVGLTTFRIAELQRGWVPSLRRSRRCLRMSGANAHHRMRLVTVVLIIHPPTATSNDAGKDSLAFTRPAFPWPDLV